MPEKRVCFVIAPIGGDNSPERKRSDRVFKHILEPAARKCGYVPVQAGKLAGSALITSEIIKHIVFDPLVIADLTGGNPNVFYELALRHAVRKPYVQIIAKNEKIRFDVQGIRTIRFDINDVKSEDETQGEIIKYIREMERSLSPLETPISAAGAGSWVPFSESGIDQTQEPVEVSPTAVRHIEDVVRILESLALAEAIPIIATYIEDLTKDPRVHLLQRPIDDLNAACSLVNEVPDSGSISATSSLQNEDADEYEAYRTAVNLALERNVVYRKVICSSSELTPERHKMWLEEFTDKAELIRSGKIEPDAFQLFHYPSPMSVDVLISQDANEKCREMVAGFAGRKGHGGFRTDNSTMVEEWLKLYLDGKIIAEAKQHTEVVIAGTKKCPCLEFLNLLDEARRQAAKIHPVQKSVAKKPRSKNRGGNKMQVKRR